ncbi:hypothetical protein H5410_038109, partial [Solanum commersonii]
IFLDASHARLQLNFYAKSCPKAEKIIQDYVHKHIPKAPSLAAALLRLHFHDCFVRNQTEKVAIPNQTLRGFSFIDGVKKIVEAECPGVVSCADIVSLVARDSVVVTGGPFWNVPTGRRDGKISNASEALANIPPPTSNLSSLQTSFANKGLDLKDLVLLSGAHTIGVSHCSSFSTRLYNFTGVLGTQDPSLDSEYASNLKGKKCKSINDNTTIVEMDPGSFRTFDLSYYKLLLKRRGLFQSDAALTTSATTKSFINQLVKGSLEEFNTEFAKAMEKMGKIEVKTGSAGEIRKQCAFMLVMHSYNSISMPRVVQKQRKLFRTMSTSTSQRLHLLQQPYCDFISMIALSGYGCDGSVLLNFTSSTKNQTEKVAIPNQTLRGFSFIDGVKKIVEAECPGVVSCADIVTLVARDSVVVTGGPFWNVPTGRRDGKISNASEALANIPPPTSNLSSLQTSFANKGLDLKDLVLLSGAHTIGVSHCSSFSTRLYNFTGVLGTQDPSLDSEYASNLKGKKCKSINDNTTIVEMDPGSFRTFDLSYYKLLLKRRGLFQSDAALTTSATTKSFINQLVKGSLEEFNAEFSKAMEKMGRIEVKTGSAGEIRKQCAFGCDGSVLLNFTSSTKNQTEKVAIPNQTLRGFSFIDGVKKIVEAECPGVVSCADIVTLVARDSVVVTGGPFWNVPTGRRDGKISNASEALANIPPPTSNLSSLQTSFANKGLDLKDLVLLSGAHTIGVSHCSSFSTRLYNFTGVLGTQDPSLDSEYASNLKGKKCKSINDNTTIVEMDPGSFRTFDLSYYKLLLKRRGLFQSDAALTTSATTKSFINQLVKGSLEEFNTEFAKAMEKMGKIEVKTGSAGDIRKQCAFVNK